MRISNDTGRPVPFGTICGPYTVIFVAHPSSNFVYAPGSAFGNELFQVNESRFGGSSGECGG